MPEELAGTPIHPLLVHGPVVFVPLLAVAAVAYALVPLVRPHIRWVLGLLALATPVSALLAKLSGDAFFDRMDREGRITEGFYPTIENHQQLGNLTLYNTTALAVLALALVYFVRPVADRAAESAAGSRRVPLLVLRVLTIAAAAVSLYYVVRTGDSGAGAAWSEF